MTKYWISLHLLLNLTANLLSIMVSVNSINCSLLNLYGIHYYNLFKICYSIFRSVGFSFSYSWLEKLYLSPALF